MGKFDDWTKLEILAELRRIETIPQRFWTEDIYLLRNRLSEIEETERSQAQKAEFDRWAADMFQQIHVHEEAMKVAKDQLDHQKKVSLVSTIVAVVAALAAIASAVAAFLARP